MKKLITISALMFAFFKGHSQCATPVFDQGASQSISCGATTQISVQNWCSGCTYAWSNGDAGINIAVSPSVTTSYNVTVTCVNLQTAVSGAHTVNVPSATIPIIEQGASQTICQGETAYLTVQNWCSGCSYLWSDGQAGINIAVSPSATTCYDVTVTDVNNCQAESSQHCVTVNSATTPIIQQGSSVTICQGETTQLTVQNWSGSCTYSWSNGDAGINIAVTQAGSYTVTANCGGCTATSSPTNVNVTPSVTPSVSVSASSINICSGDNVTFTATPTNGGSSPSYQWKLNGGNVGTNNSAYSNSTLSDGTQVYCIMTSNANCANPTTATSNTITMTVNTCTGIYDFDFNNEIKVFPNPAKDKLIVQFENSQKGKFILLNIIGQEIYNQKISDNKTEINLSEFSEGIYFLEVETEEGITRRKIFIQ